MTKYSLIFKAFLLIVSAYVFVGVTCAQTPMSSQLRDNPDLRQKVDEIVYPKGSSVTATVTAFEEAKGLASRDIPEISLALSRFYSRGISGHLDEDPSAALRWAQEAAKSDYGPAHFWLGSLYERGLHVPQDAKMAVRSYQKGLELVPESWGVHEAIFVGREFLQERPGIEPDYALAEQYLIRARDHPTAAFMLGLMSETGATRAADPSKAREYYLDAFELPYDISGKYSDWVVYGGDIKSAAAYHLAKFEREDGHDAYALELLQRAASANILPAITELAKAYENGELGLTREPARALALFEDAADQGDVHAAYAAGRIFFVTQGQGCDAGKAIAHLNAAASDGLVPAQMLLGRIYEGNTILKSCPEVSRNLVDKEKALRWFKAAQANGIVGLDSKIVVLTRDVASRQSRPYQPPKKPVQQTYASNARSELSLEDILIGAFLGAVIINELTSSNTSAGPAAQYDPPETDAGKCRARLESGFFDCTVESDLSNCSMTGCPEKWSCWHSYVKAKNGKQKVTSYIQKRRFGRCVRPGSMFGAIDFVCDPETGKKASNIGELINDVCG